VGGHGRKWRRLTDTDLCPCSEIQTMSDIVICRILSYEKAEWRLIPAADEDAVSWLAMANYGSWHIDNLTRSHAYKKKKIYLLTTGSSTSCTSTSSEPNMAECCLLVSLWQTNNNFILLQFISVISFDWKSLLEYLQVCWALSTQWLLISASVVTVICIPY